MAKKNTKNSNPHNTDSLEALLETMGWIFTNLLDSKDSHQSDIKS